MVNPNRKREKPSRSALRLICSGRNDDGLTAKNAFKAYSNNGDGLRRRHISHVVKDGGGSEQGRNQLLAGTGTCALNLLSMQHLRLWGDTK